MPPLDFVSAAEGSGLIRSIGQEILRLTFAQLGNWLADDNMRSVAVNVSAVQLREPHFARDTLEVIDAAGVDPRQLIIELTESAFPASALEMINQLSQLRARGIRVSLDDFGTGYSSLGRLQELPVDIIKVDKTFVDGIATGDENLPILNSIIDLAHNLGLNVTAEGVETATQALYLHRKLASPHMTVKGVSLLRRAEAVRIAQAGLHGCEVAGRTLRAWLRFDGSRTRTVRRHRS